MQQKKFEHANNKINKPSSYLFNARRLNYEVQTTPKHNQPDGKLHLNLKDSLSSFCEPVQNNEACSAFLYFQAPLYQNHCLLNWNYQSSLLSPFYVVSYYLLYLLRLLPALFLAFSLLISTCGTLVNSRKTLYNLAFSRKELFELPRGR